ncbi:MAG: YraN family protein [Acidobacteria bacterium]|nr:YraN family protein [Acidobacteriota bacterium]
MSVNPISSLWRTLIQKASIAVLNRQKLSPDAAAGRRGEEAAYWYLRRHGFVMVERNYRPKGLHGEIDLIGWEGDVLVFVEVKTRRAADIQTPDAAVDREKQEHVIAASREYRRHANLSSQPFRFDIVSIVAPEDAASSDVDLRHFRDAFREQAALRT